MQELAWGPPGPGSIVSGLARWAVVTLPLLLTGSKEMCQDLWVAWKYDRIAA